MSHGLEIVGNKVSFASRREPAWHGLGEVFTEDLTTEQIMRKAHLADWNIRALPYRDLMPDAWDTHLNKAFIVRDNPFYDATEAEEQGADYDQRPINLLGDASDGYSIMQNEELFEFGALFGQRWETAGSIKNGTVVFGTQALETETIIDPTGANDVIKQYLMMTTSHDGSLAMIVGVTPVRVVCQNTLNVALGSKMQSTIKLRHTKTMSERLEKAKATAEFAVKYIDTFAETATKLYQTEVTDAKFFDIVLSLNPKPEDNKKGSLTKWSAKTDTLMSLWKADTQENIAGTGWAALNALTEQQQWDRRIYSGNMENFFTAGAGLDVAANKERTTLFNTVRDAVLV